MTCTNVSISQIYPRSYEQVALIAAKELNKIDLATANVEKACGMYREHGVPDTAALCLDRGAK